VEKVMAKGQKKSTRETRKPKAEKPKAGPTTTGFLPQTKK
jgi:hypothetical protein